MTVVKNAVSIGLKLENCYLVEGGGLVVIDFWCGDKNLVGGGFSRWDHEQIFGWYVCVCMCVWWRLPASSQ